MRRIGQCWGATRAPHLPVGRQVTQGGLATVGQWQAGRACTGEMDKIGGNDYEYPNSAVAGAAQGILTQGKSDFESINEFAEEKEYYTM